MSSQNTQMTKAPGFRPGTKLRPVTLNVLMNFGGLGDMIARTPAIKYLATRYDHIDIQLWCPNYFIDLAVLFYADVDQVAVLHIEDYSAHMDPTVPMIDFSGHHTSFATNLTRHAFNVIVNQEVSERTLEYPALFLTRPPILDPYVVITCNYTAPARRMPASTIEELCRYFVMKNIRVKLLGATTTTVRTDRSDPRQGVITSEAPVIEFKHELVTDLRDQTTLREAAVIMSNAQCVLGVDNGLLHLAACTNAPIVMGMTSVNPNHRIIYRPERAPLRHVLPDQDLACRFCQSHMGRVAGHRFKYCLYDDYQCCEQMTAGKFIAEYLKLMDQVAKLESQ